MINTVEARATNDPSQVETVVVIVEQEQNTCFCDRDFTRQEVIDMIYHLRDEENFVTYRNSFFNNGTKYLPIRITEGNIDDESNESKFQDFTDEINTMFENYEINTCKRKIHFLAQMYLETTQFRSTYENRTRVPANYMGGVDFQGRGMKQITHDYNYLAYYDYINNTNYYNFYLRNRTGYESVGQFISLRRIASENGMDDDFYSDLKDFAKNLYHAFNSAGWFSTVYRNDVLTSMDAGLDDDDVDNVTRAINGGLNNITQRRNYTRWLKEFFDYDTNCINQ